MRWKYIERGELPELGDVCLIVKREGGFCVGTDGYTVGRYNEDLEQFTNRDEVIKKKYVYKWIDIGEIKNSIECDDDGREHDYEMFPAHLYVTGIECDPENGGTEYSLKSKTIKVDYANKDDDEKLFDAAKRRVPIVAEFKHVGSDLHIRNVEIVEPEDES